MIPATLNENTKEHQFGEALCELIKLGRTNLVAIDGPIFM